MKKIKRIVAICSLIVMTMTTSITAFANNTDTAFDFTVPASGKYTVYNSGRVKDNATSTYVYYTDGPLNKTLFSVHGYSKSTYSSISSLTNCTIGGSAEITRGTQRFVRQYVNEWGHKYAFLGGCNNTYPNRTIKGLWSPDSVGSYPSAN